MRTIRLFFWLILAMVVPITAAAYPGPPPPVPRHPVTKCPPTGCKLTPLYPSMAGMYGPGPRFVMQDPPGRTRIFGKAGPMWMTENVDFPYLAPNPLNPQYAFERLSLSLDTDAFWAGFLTLEHDPTYFLTLYGGIGGTIPQNGTVKMDATGRAVLAAPDNAQNLISPWTWTAKDINWWMIEGGGVFWFMRTVGIEVGFRAEHMDYQMVDPRNTVEASALGIAGGLASGLAITCGRI